jgi:hypothetical protein
LSSLLDGITANGSQRRSSLGPASQLSDGEALDVPSTLESPDSSEAHVSMLPNYTPSKSAIRIPATVETPCAQDLAEETRERVLSLVLDVTGRCPLCYVRGVKPDVHWAYRCPSKLCGSSQTWTTFKTGLRLGPSVCPRCALPYDAPCNHPPPPPGQNTPSTKCDYNDILKEIAFVIYVDVGIREGVFVELGIPPPQSVAHYRHWLGGVNRKHGGVLNFIELLGAYYSYKSKSA